MKILHTGDIHIGTAFEKLPREKAEIRKAELLEDFRSLCMFAREEKVGAVLLAGDLFDGKNVKKSDVRATFSAIESAEHIPFFYVRGNHDERLDFIENVPKNLYFFHERQSYALPENITIYGVDGAEMQERISKLSMDKNAFNILLLHGDIRSEIPLASLINKGIDYLALGHIHKPDLQAVGLDNRGKYRYCGSLESRGFDEIGDRGFFLLDIDRGRISRERFLSFSKRKCVEITLDITGVNEYFSLEKRVSELIAGERENMVKLILCGGYALGLKKDIAMLEKRLERQVFYLKIVDKTRLDEKELGGLGDLTWRGDFVRAVKESALDEELKNDMLEVGLKALLGEEIEL